MSPRNNAGFTLYELLMVVTILAILSTLAFSKYGLVQKAAAQKLSLSNQLMVSKAVETFLGLNDESLNRLDALIDVGTASGTPGTFDFTLNGTGVTGGIYRGPKPYDAANVERNNGLDSGLAAVLCVYHLTAAEAAALGRLGLRHVMRSVTAAPASADGYGLGEDGTLIRTESELDPELAACFPTAVTNGLACAAVDPRFEAGALIYQACGQELRITRTGQNIDDADVPAALASAGGKLLAFGLGAQASPIGKSNGGLEAAPYCEVLKKTYYRPYILLVRLSASGAVTRAEFAGVLDPLGNTVRAARQALK